MIMIPHLYVMNVDGRELELLKKDAECLINIGHLQVVNKIVDLNEWTLKVVVVETWLHCISNAVRSDGRCRDE